MKDEILLFSYFKGHGDGLHFAWSEDGFQWSALKKDTPFIVPEVGVEKIMRDTCVVLGKDETFHLVWTVGWNEKGIGYASSKDLITWSRQQYLPVMEHQAKARNCWAPEIFFNDKNDEYIIYWSTTIEGDFPETQAYGDDGYNHRLYYVTTKDFLKFSETKLLYDGGFNVIDGNIVVNGNEYLLFMKNETLIPLQKNIRVAFGENPLTFGEASEPLTPNHYWAEGPTAIKIDDQWFVYFDKYKINEIGTVTSSDLKLWKDISHQIKFPQGAQHGFVSRIKRKFIQHLL